MYPVLEPRGDGYRPIRRLRKRQRELRRAHPDPNEEHGQHWGEHNRHPRSLEGGYHMALDFHAMNCLTVIETKRIEYMVKYCSVRDSHTRVEGEYRSRRTMQRRL